MTPQVHRLLMTLDAVGGVWRYAMDLAAGLRQRGTEIVFAGFGPHPTPAQLAEANAVGEYVHLDAPLDWTASDESEVGSVPSLIADLAGRTGADLIHLNLPSQAAGLEVDIPVLVVSHSCVVSWFHVVRGSAVPPGWQWQQHLNQRGFDLADIVVAPSRSHADLLAKCYRGIEQVSVVHNSVRPIAGNAVHMPFIIAAGRWWDEGKNAKTLDAAARDCRWPVHMAGANQAPNGHRTEVQNANLLGELASPELRRLMAEASIFVSPSIYEPFGLAPLEAASAGLPLVLSDIPTYRELWDGAALFAEPENPREFSHLLNRLADDTSLRAELGRRAMERAAGFTVDRQVNAMTAAYAKALQPLALRAIA